MDVNGSSDCSILINIQPQTTRLSVGVCIGPVTQGSVTGYTVCDKETRITQRHYAEEKNRMCKYPRCGLIAFIK